MTKNWEAIINLMDDELRERVAFELAPCTNEEFFKALFRTCARYPERSGYGILERR